MTNLFGNKNIIVPSNNPAPIQPEKETKDITVLWCDNGLFMDYAIQCSKQFKKSYYWTPCLESDFANIKDALLGSGLEDEGLYRIIDLFSPGEDNGYCFDDIDLFIFPDVGYAGYQHHLVSIGKWVWGNRYAENLELWRWQAKQIMNDLDMPVNETDIAEGIEELKEAKDKDGKYIKISCWRNSFETFKFIDENQSKPRIAEIEYSHGEAAKLMQFLIETPVETDIEVGSDTYCIDGKYPETNFGGYEIKGVAFAGVISKTIPKQMKYIADKMAPIFKQYGNRGNISFEARIEEKTEKPFVIDWTVRLGSPPNEIQARLITNLGDIMWYGAHGILKEPEYKFKYGMLVRIFCDWAGKHWEEIEFDKEIRQWISLRKFCKINDKYYIIPNYAEITGIGSIVSVGNSIDECRNKIEKLADKVKGYDLDIKLQEIDKLDEEIKKGNKIGIKF